MDWILSVPGSIGALEYPRVAGLSASILPIDHRESAERKWDGRAVLHSVDVLNVEDALEDNRHLTVPRAREPTDLRKHGILATFTETVCLFEHPDQFLAVT